MGAIACLRPLVDLQRIAGYDAQATQKFPIEFCQRGEATPIAFDRNDLRACIKQGAGQAARAGADLIDRSSVERAGNRGDARQQLAIEDEVLAERLGCLQPVTGDHVAQRLGHGFA
jgi:hypothetical protein